VSASKSVSARISKRADNPRTLARLTIPFPNARTAFKAFLRSLDFSANDTILLPAYVGWSKNEGSGVFDPVQEVDVQFRFYRLTRELAIDLTDLQRQIQSAHPKVVVLIHYFGFPDPHLAEAVALARDGGAFVLEDEAHALYSDLISGICGRFGDAAIMSLHKMLPFTSGGWLVLNGSLDPAVAIRLRQSPLQQALEQSPWQYDLFQIAARRRHNAIHLLDLLVPLRDRVAPLFAQISDGVVPQTLPVIISLGSRDDLYFEMNKRGFGVISLYHTMIQPIREVEYPDSHWLSKRILNLPVHQDIQPGDLEAMVSQLDRFCR
jgi:dTDP-4-amino-4,6-dideoxygalactose transaminase